MTHGRVAPDYDNVAGERVFAVQLTATIFCQNNFHLYLRGTRQYDFPIVIFFIGHLSLEYQL